MKKEVIEKLFADHTAKATREPIRKSYDIKITLNKSGKSNGGFSIRFAFLNKAAEIYKKGMYIEPTDVEKLKDRIYFRCSEEKEHSKMFKVSSSSSRSGYTALSPTAEAEKIYRALWIGKEFNLEYDEECGLYFIENH